MSEGTFKHQRQAFLTGYVMGRVLGSDGAVPANLKLHDLIPESLGPFARGLKLFQNKGDERALFGEFASWGVCGFGGSFLASDAAYLALLEMTLPEVSGRVNLRNMGSNVTPEQRKEMLEAIKELVRVIDRMEEQINELKERREKKDDPVCEPGPEDSADQG